MKTLALLQLGALLVIRMTAYAQTGDTDTGGRHHAERGVALYRDGDYTGARLALEQAVKEAPSDLRAWQDLGWTLYHLGETNQATSIWQDILVTDPAFIRARNAMGHVLQQQGRAEPAAIHYLHSLKIERDQVNVWVRLGECLEEVDRLDHAAFTYRAALQYESDHESAALHLARLLGQRGQWDQAATFLMGFKEASPAHTQAVSREQARIEGARGAKAYGEEDFETAATRFAYAFQLDPEKPRYAIDQGWAQRRAGKTQQALDAWTRAARLEPLDPGSLHLAMAEASQELGRPEEARNHYETALSLLGEVPRVLYRYALMELQEGRASGSLPLVERALRDAELEADWGRRLANALVVHGISEPATKIFENAHATHASAATADGLTILYHHAGVEAYRADRYDKAVEAFRAARALSPASKAVLRDQGWAYWRAGNLKACGQAWQELANTNPDFAVAHDLLAQYYLRLGNYEAAAEAARTCLSKDPDYMAARKHLARALVDSGRPGEARALLEALSQQHADDGGIQQLYGLALTKLLDYQQAEPQWRRVLQILPDSVIAQQNWVDALYRIGKHAEALEAARRFSRGSAPPAAILELLGHDAFRGEHFAEAERWFNRLTDLHHERPGYWLKVSDCLAAQGKFQLRPALLHVAVRLRPDRGDLQLELCAALADAGREDESIQAFAAHLRKFPYDYLAFNAYLDTLRRFGHYEEALRVLNQNRFMFYQPHEAAFRRADLLRMLKRYQEADTVLNTVVSTSKTHLDIPIIVYHGLSAHADSADMPVANFDAQLAALREAGYTSLTVTELANAVQHTESMPEKPVVITFDDARTESFALADPILERHGMKATMFVPTSRITEEDLYHASIDSLRRYARTGRWELQSHGHEAHNWITATSAGHTGSFLGCRMWLPSANRYETEAEFRSRLQGDYRESAAQIRALSKADTALGYAFPYSDIGQSVEAGGYAPAVVNCDLVKRVFGFGFIQRPSGYNRIIPEQPLPALLRRFTVPYEWGGEDLVEFLAADRPDIKALIEKAKGASWEGRYETAEQIYRDLKRQDGVLAQRCDRALTDLAMARGRGSEAMAIIQGAGMRDVQLDPSMHQRLEWLIDPVSGIRAGYQDDSEGRSVAHTSLHGRWRLHHDVSFSVRAGAIRMEEDELGDAPGYELDGSVSTPLPGNWQLHADAGFSALDGTDDSITGGLAFRKRADLHDTTIQWGYRNIDALRARQADISFHRISAAYAFHSVQWPFAARYMHWEISDGNTRADARCRLFHRLPAFPDWQVGCTLEYADVDFQTPDYYTPEELIAPRAAVRYDYRKADTWSGGFETGIGTVLEANSEDRLTARSTFRLSKEWRTRTRLGIWGFYSTTAGYTASGIEGNLQYRF